MPVYRLLSAILPAGLSALYLVFAVVLICFLEGLDLGGEAVEELFLAGIGGEVIEFAGVFFEIERMIL